MSNSHSKSFFSQNIGFFLQSNSRTEEAIFFQFIKRKDDGSWEKPSDGEGKTIKISLEEIIMLLEVLCHKKINWECIHSYKGINTQISIGWEDDNQRVLWINASEYNVMLNIAQSEILRLLLEHLLEEKIKYATVSRTEPTLKKNKVILEKPSQQRQSNSRNHSKNKHSEDTSKNYEITNEKEITNLKGSIMRETQKALLIDFQNGQEIWIPKSTVRGVYRSHVNTAQKFQIDSWILKRNKVIS